jgi:hypothetical protein
MPTLGNAMSRALVNTPPSGFRNQPCGTNHGLSLYYAIRSSNSTDSLTPHHRTPNITSPWFDDDNNYGAALVITYCPCSSVVIFMYMIPRSINVTPWWWLSHFLFMDELHEINLCSSLEFSSQSLTKLISFPGFRCTSRLMVQKLISHEQSCTFR